MTVTKAKHLNDPLGSSQKWIVATIDGVEWTVPAEGGTHHYDEIQEWVAAGNTLEAAD